MTKKPFVLAHVSDLHASEFGDTFHDRLRLVRRSAHPVALDPAHQKIRWAESGWKVLDERGALRARTTLIDPEGYRHGIPMRVTSGTRDPVERAAFKACRLEARRAETLTRSPPSPGALDILLEATPRNSNLRLLKSAQAIGHDVDAVVITGDLTDDGIGFELVRLAFKRFADKGMLFVVPGNHDRYLFPIAGSGRPRPTAESKKEAYTAFANSLGLNLDPSGAWVRVVDDSETVLVGLDSCSRKQRRFFRHNGALGESQLNFLRTVSREVSWKRARHRIVLLHHHVVPLPHGVGRRAPPEVGMRLDDAKSAAECFDECGVTMVLHGHRHVSEQRHPAGSRFLILAAPSFTLGCRSGDAPSYWRVELGERAHITRATVAMASTHDADAVSVEDVEPGLDSSPDVADSETALLDPGSGSALEEDEG